jgi:phosphoadenosine phosphosulfate reductase
MIDQLNIYGLDKVEVAIGRIKQIEPRGGSWYLAFSGGKDSCVIKALCDMAGVKYDAHYRVSSVDPPELIRFIKEKHPDVSMDFPRDKDGKVITMWNLIPKKHMPPTRMVRYCCKYLKEDGGKDRDKITGVRWAESVRRKNNRSGLEIEEGHKDRTKLDPDNMDEDMVRYCMQSKGFILNPIIDWTTDEVWEFIHRYNIPYCKLYDEGFSRLGCIGCPMATPKEKEREFKKYPKFKEAYIRAFDRMIQHQIEGGYSETKERRTLEVVDELLTGNEIQSKTERNYIITGYSIHSDTGTDVFKWWLAR